MEHNWRSFHRKLFVLSINQHNVSRRNKLRPTNVCEEEDSEREKGR